MMAGIALDAEQRSSFGRSFPQVYQIGFDVLRVVVGCAIGIQGIATSYFFACFVWFC